MTKLMYKFTTISTLCVAAWMSTGCQTTTPTLSPKDPEKAIQVRTQLAAEYLKSGDLDWPNVPWIRHWKQIRVILWPI